uniref:Uncharacterized protein n=1 Tax=Globisporangium ultimum (strain ATCC 200006 / CBS 805.95 / DAOM BR144) TaxID=431595 RepID=K3WBJ8_GLOUD
MATMRSSARRRKRRCQQHHEFTQSTNRRPHLRMNPLL